MLSASWPPCYGHDLRQCLYQGDARANPLLSPMIKHSAQRVAGSRLRQRKETPSNLNAQRLLASSPPSQQLSASFPRAPRQERLTVLHYPLSLLCCGTCPSTGTRHPVSPTHLHSTPSEPLLSRSAPCAPFTQVGRGGCNRVARKRPTVASRTQGHGRRCPPVVVVGLPGGQANSSTRPAGT